MKDDVRSDEFIRNELAAMNYSIISERPLTIKEQWESYELDFGYNYLSGINTNSIRYKNKMLRHFEVKNEKEHTFELIITIVQTWGDKIIYKINSTTRIRN